MIIGFALRSAWLLLGAAIAVALVLVVSFAGGFGLTTPLDPTGAAVAVHAAAVIIGAGLIGLLPGVRDLEVTAAGALLRSSAELVSPTRPTLQHRLRTVAWTVFHALAGLIAGMLIFGGGPAAVVIGVQQLVPLSAEFGQLPAHDWPVAGQLALAVVLLVLIMVLLWAVGRFACWAAPLALGPTSADRLQLAESRLAKEAHQVALARELHDGIGHALSAISIQAAGGQRMLHRDTEATGRALTTIEDTARRAQQELDGLLGALREPGARRTPEPDLGQLGELIETHRRLGLIISDDVDLDTAELPGLVSTTAYRVAAEGLGNAHAHAGPGAVQLEITGTEGAVELIITSPRRAHRQRRSTGGRGLAGLTERIGVLGGTVDAGPAGEQWVLTATIPYGSRP